MTVETAGRHVEEVLDRLAATGDPAAASAAEELVRGLMDFYGAGLARMVALLSKGGGEAMGRLLDDEVLTALLVLHELHPEHTMARVARGLKAAGAASTGIAGFDEHTGALLLAPPAGDGCGCPGTTTATLQRIETALSCFAPEVVTVAWDGAGAGRREPALLQIGPRPAGAP
jgi:hypothetical protein